MSVGLLCATRLELHEGPVQAGTPSIPSAYPTLSCKGIRVSAKIRVLQNSIQHM